MSSLFSGPSRSGRGYLTSLTEVHFGLFFVAVGVLMLLAIADGLQLVSVAHWPGGLFYLLLPSSVYEKMEENHASTNCRLGTTLGTPQDPCVMPRLSRVTTALHSGGGEAACIVQDMFSVEHGFWKSTMMV